MKKKERSFRHTIAIGDWSGDGHGRCEKYTFAASHNEDAVIEGYNAAIKASGVALNSFHGQGRQPKYVKHTVCVDYEDSKIPADALKALKKIGVTFKGVENKENENDEGEKELYVGAECIAQVFFQMVATQIPGFSFRKVKERASLNEWKNEKIDGFIGYGVFHG